MDFDAMLSSAADKLQTDADRVNADKKAKRKAKRNDTYEDYIRKLEELERVDAAEEIRKKIAAQIADEAHRALREKWLETVRNRSKK